MKITVFTAPDCPKCRMTLTRFSLAGVDVNEIPLVDNADLVRLTQNTGAPLVVVVNDSGRVTGWGGFRPDLIATTANGWSVGSLDIPPSLVYHVLHCGKSHAQYLCRNPFGPRRTSSLRSGCRAYRRSE